MRNFRTFEKSTLQFQRELFNAVNHANFAMDQANGGTITSARDPRLMQLGIRYSF